MLDIVVLVSGGGTNLQTLIDRIADGTITNGRIVKVISSRRDAYALERAKKHGIPSAVVPRGEYEDAAGYEAALHAEIAAASPGLIVLGGFLSKLSSQTVAMYPNRILNIHPALIPAFSGQGYYGLRVHRAALERGVKLTGATVHFVSEDYDAGPIILQKAVAVEPDDTPEILQQRVMTQAEQVILPQAVNLVCNGRVEVAGKTVRIKERGASL